MKIFFDCRGKKALTLVELLIGASILSGLVLSFYAAFHAAILAYSKIDSAAGDHEAARMVLKRMEADLRNGFIFSANDSGFRGGPASFEFFTQRSSFDANGDSEPHVSYVRYDVSLPVLRYSVYDDINALTRETPQISDELSVSLESAVLRYGQVTSGAEGKTYTWSDAWPPEEAKKPLLPAVVAVELNFVARASRQKEAQDSFKAQRTMVLPLTTGSSGGA